MIVFLCFSLQGEDIVEHIVGKCQFVCTLVNLKTIV